MGLHGPALIGLPLLLTYRLSMDGSSGRRSRDRRERSGSAPGMAHCCFWWKARRETKTSTVTGRKEKANKDWVASLAKIFKRPILIEIWDRRFAYFDPKFEFNFVDCLDKAAALTTVQIDHENSKRYGIEYTDNDNRRKHPLILHCSPPGAIPA